MAHVYQPSHKQHTLSQQDMRDLFDEVDVDGNGVVTRAELSLRLAWSRNTSREGDYSGCMTWHDVSQELCGVKRPV